jgi:Holliday junction resolvasome RuvABC endonuclease subunit
MKVMGIDLGTRKIAYALWQDGVLVETDAYESNAPLRQVQLMDIHDFIWEVVDHIKPDHIFIEDTLVGNNVKYSIQLAQVMGATQVALASRGLSDMFGIYLVNNKTWKKDVVGNGNASKDLVQLWLYQLDTAYSVLCGSDQDRYDAAAIGYYGTLIAERAEVLA